MSIVEERRLVTVLFVDLVGFTSRTEATDPEEMRDVQRAYFAATAEAVERYGGRVEKYIGDAVMALYGAPQAHDDDASRALHAALAIREAVAVQGLEVRIGVNTGEVVGGAGAGPQAGEYTVTGDAVNVAARLQQAAAPMEIYVGATTRRLSADAFEFAPIQQLELKGKADPVEAWRLVRAAHEPRLARGGEAPLVGRGRELRMLEDVLEEAGEGRGLVVGLAGEAGIGKSRLAVETRLRAETLGFASAWASAPSYSTTFPYHLVRELVEHLEIGPAELTRLAPDPESGSLWSAAIADLTGTATAEDAASLHDASPARRQRLIVQALNAVLVARSEDRPHLLVLDDAHWADASSIAVLDELLTLVPDHRIVVLALFRPGWENPWSDHSGYQQINLNRLREADARALLDAISPTRPLAEAQTAELLHRSAGNPFFLEELVRSQPADGDAAGRLPETVHELLLARIDHLGAEARTALQVAAVAGTHFSEGLLGAIEPDIDAEAALAELSRADLLLPLGGTAADRGFAVRHPLVHEVAYRSLLAARRKELHRRTGAWLEAHGGDDALAEVAAHYRDGADLDRARELLPRAAERAASVHALHESIEAFLAAADLFEDDPARRAAMLERAAAQCFLLARLEDAVRLIGEARGLYEQAGDEVRALNARRLTGRYYWLQGRGGALAAEEVDAAVAGLERLGSSEELALAYTYRAQLAFLAPDYALGERLARRAIEVADEVGSVEALTHALNNLGMCRYGLGDAEGITDVKRSLALSLEHNLVDDAARAYTNLSGQGYAINVFSPDEAEALFDEMLAFDQRTVPGGNYELWHLAGQAEFWIATGRWDEAERLLRDMLTAGTSANSYIALDVAAFLSMLMSYRGRPDEAASLIRPFVDVAVQIGDLQAVGPAFVALAHAELRVGDAAAAEAAIERGIGQRGMNQETHIGTWILFEATDVATWLVETDREAGNRALAVLHSLGDSLLLDAERGGTPPALRVRHALREAALAQGRCLRGEAGPDTAAAFRTAADALRQERRMFDAARVDLWRAEALGDDSARAAARAVFHSLAAAPYLRRAGPKRAIGADDK